MPSVEQEMGVSCSEKETMAARKLLVLNASWPLEAIRERKLEATVTNTDLDGFFEHVWTVHPFATLVTSNDGISKYGSPEVHAFAQRHTFIEGKVGRFPFLKWLEPLNFLISQIDIFFSLTRLIRKEKISVIDAWTPLYPGLLAWGMSRLCGIPLLLGLWQTMIRSMRQQVSQQSEDYGSPEKLKKLLRGLFLNALVWWRLSTRTT